MKLIALAILLILAHIVDGACIRRRNLRWRRMGDYLPSYYRKFLSKYLRTNFYYKDLMVGYHVLLPTSEQKFGSSFLDAAILSYFGDYWPVYLRFRRVNRTVEFEYRLSSRDFMDGLYECKLEL